MKEWKFLLKKENKLVTSIFSFLTSISLKKGFFRVVKALCYKGLTSFRYVRKRACEGPPANIAQKVEGRTPEHSQCFGSLQSCGYESRAGQLKLRIVFRMRC